MGAKSEALAKPFEAKVDEATKVIERLSEADWKKTTTAEKWSVGVSPTTSRWRTPASPVS